MCVFGFSIIYVLHTVFLAACCFRSGKVVRLCECVVLLTCYCRVSEERTIELALLSKPSLFCCIQSLKRLNTIVCNFLWVFLWQHELHHKRNYYQKMKIARKKNGSFCRLKNLSSSVFKSCMNSVRKKEMIFYEQAFV